jgi:small subunit ribosomal protein S20
MPNSRSAKKSLRKSKKRGQRNKVAKAEVDSMRNKFRHLMEEGKLDEAEELAQTISKKLDKLESRGILKKNTVARRKSRLMKKLNRKKEA